MAIPPWALTVIENLSEDQQSTLMTIGGKAMMDPWFSPMASVPAALFLVYVPHFIKLGVALSFLNINYNNVLPRYENWDEKIGSKWAVDLIRRCLSCHENSFEAFLAFAPAVVMCRAVRVKDVSRVKELTTNFIKFRVLYTLAYILGQYRIVAAVRTLLWGAAFQTTFQLYGVALMG